MNQFEFGSDRVARDQLQDLTEARLVTVGEMLSKANEVRAQFATLINATPDEIGFLFATTEGENTVASNRKARHDYAIQETLEAGIQLTGDEVKSLRGGRASLGEAYARVRDGEAWLEGMHIPPYEQGDKRRHLPMRPRKLLLHRREIDRLVGQQQEERLSLVPLRVYFVHGLAKVEIGVGRGKREFEKRQSIAKRESQREIEQQMGRRR